METLTCNCLGYDVYSGSLDQISASGPTIFSTINQYSYCLAENDTNFRNALQRSDVLLPDGVGIVMAAKFLDHHDIKKISGWDLHQHMLEKLNASGGSCFYLGSTPSTLEKIKSKLRREYPNIKVSHYSPPFKPEFNDADDQEMIDRINEANPDVLFIGMTAPKQEKWAILHKQDLKAKYICAIGAVFDFYSGNIKRPGQIWIDLGLEWLGRFVSEPKRLYKRYTVYGAFFAYRLLIEKMRRMISKRGPEGVLN